MSELSDKKVLIVDSGLFFNLALHLSQAINPDGFGRVLYHTPFDEDHQSVEEQWGDGFADLGIHRCNDFWLRMARGDKFEEISLFVFPDTGHIGAQVYLESLGHRVVGSKEGQELELYRSRFRKLQSKLGMDVPEYITIKGISRLTQHLAPLENKFLKIDRWRADFETRKWRSWEQDNGLLDKLAVKFGPFKELIDFMVEDEIKTDIEDGGDFLIVNGQAPSHALIGVEKKNQAYCSFIRPYADLDPQITSVLEPLLPTLAKYRYSNFLSTEQRKTKTENVLTDITTRLGFPSGSCQLQAYGNLPQLLYAAGAGESIEIEPACKVVIECLMDHADGFRDWRSIRVEDKLWPWLNPREAMLAGDVLHFPRNHFHTACIGSINGVGNTVQEAADHLMEVADMLKGQPVEISLDAVRDLVAEINEAEETGINFTDTEVPEPEEVLAGNGE